MQHLQRHHAPLELDEGADGSIDRRIETRAHVSRTRLVTTYRYEGTAG